MWQSVGHNSGVFGFRLPFPLIALCVLTCAIVRHWVVVSTPALTFCILHVPVLLKRYYYGKLTFASHYNVIPSSKEYTECCLDSFHVCLRNP